MQADDDSYFEKPKLSPPIQRRIEKEVDALLKYINGQFGPSDGQVQIFVFVRSKRDVLAHMGYSVLEAEH